MSLFKILIIKPIGVTTIKKIIIITIGEIIFPRKIPNLNQILFKGVSNFEFNNPNKRKINEAIKNQMLKLPSFINGNNAIIKKTTKNIIPKLLFELIVIKK